MCLGPPGGVTSAQDGKGEATVVDTLDHSLITKARLLRPRGHVGGRLRPAGGQQRPTGSLNLVKSAIFSDFQSMPLACTVSAQGDMAFMPAMVSNGVTIQDGTHLLTHGLLALFDLTGLPECLLTRLDNSSIAELHPGRAIDLTRKAEGSATPYLELLEWAAS